MSVDYGCPCGYLTSAAVSHWARITGGSTIQVHVFSSCHLRSEKKIKHRHATVV